MASLVATPSLVDYVTLTSIRFTSRFPPQKHRIVPLPVPLIGESMRVATAISSFVKSDLAAVSPQTDI